MRRILLIICAVVIIAGCEKPKYQQEDIKVTGISEPVICLDGTWKFTMNPPVDFHADQADPSRWNDILVPGECAMQGFPVKHNVPYVYKKQVSIPSDYAGKNIFIRFDNVYSYARIWVNGHFIREHKGGFTSWLCDITEVVKPGENAWLTVEFTDRDDDLSYASGYAKHPIGGILRSVWLLARPAELPEELYVTTTFDKKYRDAELTITLVKHDKAKTWAGFRLYGPDGKYVRLSDSRFFLDKDTNIFRFNVKNPAKWSAEKPELYTLITEIFDPGVLKASLRTRFGFREIKISGNKLLVNGSEVKLRGACRHDIHPLLGRVSIPEYDLKDVQLAKEANMNFIRTSHYPPSEAFLEFCDEYGLYVEAEAPVCFVGTHRNRFYSELKQYGPEFFDQQVSQVEEMVKTHFNHPSVIIWSLGNESNWGDGFRMAYDFVKSFDAGRPVMFSYPGLVPGKSGAFDILSMHYPSYQGNISQYGFEIKNFDYAGMPVIYDEWAHVPCYNKPELLNDMNVRNFWGQSLDSMWSNLFESEGTGGAIWGMIDETFMLPDTMPGYGDWWGIQETSNGINMYEGPAIGYGEWGIIDTWRRKKPEFWNTKKAYSPIRIPVKEITKFKSLAPLEIPVYNRFDHTNLRELIVSWNCRGRKGTDRIWNVEPHSTGTIQLPPHNWKKGDIVNLRFLSRDSVLIDEYNIRLGKTEEEKFLPTPGNYTITDAGDGRYLVSSSNVNFIFNKRSGLINNLLVGSDTLITSGPYLHLRLPDKEHWSVTTFSDLPEKFIPAKSEITAKDGTVTIAVSGYYGNTGFSYTLDACGDGNILLNYTVSGLDASKKIEEAGVSFKTGLNIASVVWSRDSCYSAWPDIHPGAAYGLAVVGEYNHKKYREQPPQEWSLDNSSFYYNGLNPVNGLSWLASSLKDNIRQYILNTTGNSSITVWSDGSHNCRLKAVPGGYTLITDRYRDYMNLAWGNYTANIRIGKNFSDSIRLQVK